MAAENRTIESFGEVSRLTGTVFRYALVAATLVGIVTLGVLLLYVTNDAIQPLTADPRWHLTFLVTLVVPSAVTGLWLRRKGMLDTGLIALGLPFVGLLFGSGASLLFVDIIPPLAWLAYVIATVVAVGVVLVLTRLDPPFLAKLVAALVGIVGAYALIPPVVTTIPTIPTGGVIMAITLGGLAGVLTYAYARNRFAPRQAQGLGVGILALVAAGIVVGPLLGMGQVPGVVLMSSVAAPTALYVLTVVRGERNRLGLLLPAVVIGGAFLGAFAVQQLGFAGPQSWLDWQFLTSNHRNDPEQAGVYAALAGTIMLMLMVALLSFPLGVGAAVYLEEYAPSNWVTRLIKVNISNLAGVPSVVYGLLGLGLFVNYLDGGLPVVGKAELFNPGTVIIGGITLSLLILPIVIVSSREAIRAVPDSLRQASYGMGATRWQTIRKVVLPRALPGILTGTILALGRAIGETAPLLVIGAPQVFDLPQQLSDPVGAVPLQIFSWATTFASPAFYTTALAAGVVTLLVVLLAMNSVAIVVRNKYQQRN